jgi:hypothetical protein
VVVSNGHLITASSNPSNIRFFIKSHVVGSDSQYETIQESTSNRWVYATTNGTNLVNSEDSATRFKITTIGPRYKFYVYDPQNPDSNLALGVDNGPIGS